PSAPGISEEQVPLGIEIEVVGAFEQLIAVGIDQRLDLFRLRVVDENATVAGRQIELALVPASALRLARLPQFRSRVEVEHRTQLAIRVQVGYPATANRHEPEIPLAVERATFQKLALRRVTDIGEFFDWPDSRRQWRQPPRQGWIGGRCRGLRPDRA